jgi:L-arabinose isomerase
VRVVSVSTPKLTVDKEAVSVYPALRRKKPKIGFLGLAFFEYWRMYGEQLKQKVERNHRTIVEDLNKNGNLEIVNPGLIDTLEKAVDAAQLFKREEIDLLVVWEGTYAPDYYTVQLLDFLPNVPLFILQLQEMRTIPLDIKYADIVATYGLIGIVQLLGDFSKIGKKYGLAVGAIGEKEAYKELEDYAAAVTTVNRLRWINIGVIGRVFRGMYELEWDKTKVKWRLGPNIFYIEIREFLDLFKQVTDSEANELMADLTKKYRVEETTKEEVLKACRYAVAIRRLVEKFRLDATSHLCQWYLHSQTETTPCIGCSRLNEIGIMTTCEGDVGQLIVMCILDMLTGKPPFYGEWALYDLEENTILIQHHGLGNPQLAVSPDDIRITSHIENWGYSGLGAAFEFIGKPGRVTMCSVIDDVEGIKMLITGGESVKTPARPVHTAHFIVKTDRPVREFLQLLLKSGVPHHVVLVHGDARKQLECVADLMGIRKLVI